MIMKAVFIESIGFDKETETDITKRLSDKNIEVSFYNNKPENSEDALERVKDADIIITSQYPISDNIINSCNNLKLISVAFTGTDHINTKLCNNKNIVVCNAAGYSTDAVAELTVGMAIDIIRKTTELDAKTRKSEDRAGFLGTQLKDKTFGIIGFGAIGKRVAELTKAFGCNNIAYSRTKKQTELAQFRTFEEVIKESDIISIHTPLTDETQGLINKDVLSLTKQNVILINTARGPIVDYKALSEMLNSNQMAGAAIDVYETEPPIAADHPLQNTKNCLLLPHIGFATKEAIEIRTEIVLQNILKWTDGAPQNVVNL